MTQEEKAKAYDEALKIARCWLNDPQTIQDCNYTIEDAIQNIFPELKESEDERIRKGLIEALKTSKTIGELKFTLPEPTREECIAYLEKQKEQKPDVKDPFSNANFVRGYESGYADAKREQKPMEIHIDNPNIQKFDPDVKVTTSDSSADGKELLYVCNKSYKIGYRDGVASVKPAEWSEEDEDMLNSCISSIEEAKENRYAYKETDGDTSYDHEIAWLKSLCPSWKPSEEQLVTLLRAEGIVRVHDTKELAADLARLYEQLKKL